MSIESYIEGLRKRRLSPRTLELYQVELRTFERLDGDKERIENHLMGCGAATHARKLMLWKRYLKFKGSKLLDGFQLPKIPHKQPSFIHGSDIEALLGASKEFPLEIQIFIEAGLTLGLRLEEIMQLSSDRLQNDWIRIKRKGGSEQFIPLTVSLETKLKDFKGFRHSKEFYRQQLDAAARRAGIAKRVTPHTLRHSFATRAIQEGNDIVTLKEALGHRSIKTTEMYCHVTPDSLKKLIRREHGKT